MKLNTTNIPIKEKFTVHVMAISEFEEIMKKSNFTDENIEEVEGLAIISITLRDEHYFKKNHANVLNIEFYDIEEDVEINGCLYVPFSVEQAKKLIDFIELNQKKNFIIHCHAGISLSGAVAQFITDFYGWADKSTFRFQYGKKIVPNTVVTKKLKEEWFRRHSKLDIQEYQDMLKKNDEKIINLNKEENGENT